MASRLALLLAVLGLSSTPLPAALAQAPGSEGLPPDEAPTPEPPSGDAVPPPLDVAGSAEDPPPLGSVDVLQVGGGRPLTLERVIESVRTHYPPLLAERQRVRAAEAERQIAAGGFDVQLDAQGKVVTGYYDYYTVDAQVRQPTQLWGLSVFGGWRLGRGFDPAGLDGTPPSYLDQGSIPGYYGELETLGGGEVRVGATLPLWRGGPIDSRRAATRRADLGARAARAGFTARRLVLEREAATTYWKWVSAGVKYRIAAELLALAEQREAQIARRVARGALPNIERWENRRAVWNRRGGLVDARRGLEAAAIDLSLYLRRDDGRPRLPSADELPRDVPEPRWFDLPALRESVSSALSQRPESARVAALVGRSEVARELADNQAAPQIDVTVVGSQDLGAARADQDKRLGDFVFSGSLVFSTPLQRRALTGAADRATAELLATRAEASFVLQTVVADVLDARSAVTAARERVDAAEGSADASQVVAAAERRRFELGSVDLFRVNLREQAAAEAESKRADARAEAHAAFAFWRAALGRGAVEDAASAAPAP